MFGIISLKITRHSLTSNLIAVPKSIFLLILNFNFRIGNDANLFIKIVEVSTKQFKYKYEIKQVFISSNINYSFCYSFFLHQILGLRFSPINRHE